MKLFVLDLMNLAFRAYYGGTKNLKRSDGQPTSVVFGMALAINALLREHKPDFLVVAADPKGRTFRHDMFAGYKANRGEAPDDFTVQLPAVHRLVEAFGFKTMKVPGVEADDVIGSIVEHFKKFTQRHHLYGNLVGQEPHLIGEVEHTMEIVIVSADKDMMQLIDTNVSMLKPLNGGGYKALSFAEVEEKFGVKPSQVVDCLALMGDAVDCIPGVSGIGEKTASKLIKSYGSVEGIYQNLHTIPTKMAQKLHADQANAILSKSLAKMKLDVPMTFTLDEVHVSPKIFQRQQLQDFYKEFEFFSLVNVDQD